MKLINFLKKNKKLKIGSLRKSIEIDPFFYWRKILILMLIILIIVVISSFFVYHMVNKGKFIDKATRLEVKSMETTELKATELNKITNIFSNRKNIRVQIIQDESVTPDPSINPNVPVLKETVLETVQKPKL